MPRGEAPGRRTEGRPGRPRLRPRAFPLAALLLLVLLPACSRRGGPDPGGVVAEVGEERITVEDVRREVALRRGLPASLATGGAGRAEVEEALRRLVEEAYVVAEGRRRGLTVPAGELEAEVTRHRADFPPGGLEKALAQAGLEEGPWREGLRRSLLHRKSAEAVAAAYRSRAASAPADSLPRAAAKGDGRGAGGGGGPAPPGREGAPGARVKVRELVFSTKSEASSARVLLAAGRTPRDAASLAAGRVPPASVELGWFPVDALPPGVPPEVAGLPRGGVSGVVSFPGGHAVFVAEDRREEGAPSPVPGVGRVEGGARAADEEALRLWLEEARGRTKVRIDEELLSTLYPGRP